ncbi:hypothetical protein QBC46DRAFT_438367 [Diplogelasinospora grovesii]|uniref:Nitrate reductase [NADPH] n=1 Tax=Diplogelasinospora grovesii TaxID=303347 RepID=A0AAN6N4Z6_9PEZI|nr:hypothetical protein QBC46DRAFT_438367 [Diplogelasinospora grovesii]
MPHHIPWTVRVQGHPGSSADDIQNEPDWAGRHSHRVGYKNRDGRRPGITHQDDEHLGGDGDVESAKKRLAELRREVDTGRLVNFRDLVEGQEDFHLGHPENRSQGWRYVLDTSEQWVKEGEPWPANLHKREQQQQYKQTLGDGDGGDKQGNGGKRDGTGVGNGTKDKQGGEKRDEDKQEHELKRADDRGKHHDARHTGGTEDDEEGCKYTPQELALLRALEHERDYIANLGQSDGRQPSPQSSNMTSTTIDEHPVQIRLTGKHPMNSEPRLSGLFDAGLITPNELHYIRNHGAVPRLLWEFHKLDVECDWKRLTLRMDELKDNYDMINIPIALACTGNRRKELNLMRKTKGASNAASTVGCAYWKGPLLRDVLLSAGVPEKMPAGKRFWETSIPFEYCMDPTNDVLLAMYMNDVPLPPDYGYPVRVMIPGYIGGRCVKWLKKIWISDHENTSHYHIWDNRVLPSFVTEKDGAFAEALFHHPDTACYEQNFNSVIVHPAHDEQISVGRARKGEAYRIQGYAYDGGGHPVQMVEVSLDGGDTWLYCVRKYPDNPIRHGNKFWSWLHWHVDVSLSHLLRAESVTVRAFNAFKNTQPETPHWNTMGMMNNSRYVVKLGVVDGEDGMAAIRFKHPTESGSGEGGWMQPSEEVRISQAKQQSGTPDKIFTRHEIEKHDKEDDCWIVADGKVYDVTSVLAWHPGGKEAVLAHAGKVHHETSEEMASIHDDYAYAKLKECILGRVSEKAAKFIKANAEAAAREKANSQGVEGLALQKHRWVPVKLVARKQISEDTKTYTFQLPDGKKALGLGTCQHVQIGFHLRDKMVIRPYTPTRPLLPPTDATPDKGMSGNDSEMVQELADGKGTFDLTVKVYFPDENQPGGALSNILDCVPIGEEVEMRGPTGDIIYHGNGKFTIEGKERRFERVSLVLGGSGLTPGYSLIARILLTPGDHTKVRVVDANKTEDDILLKEELDGFGRDYGGEQFKIAHVLSHPSDKWKGLKGHVTGDILKANLFPPEKGERDKGSEGSVMFLCGPPGMIQGAVLPALRDWGYVEDENMFGF